MRPGSPASPVARLGDVVMTTQSQVALDDLATLLPDWRTHLRARNIAATTISSYHTVGENLLRFLRAQGMPTTATGVKGEHLEAFLADLGDRVSPATTAKHYRSLQQLFRWLLDDGEIIGSPMERMRPPLVPEQPVDIFTDDELIRLLAAAKGNTFENRRDTALLRMLIDTGMRAAELMGLAVTDLDDEQSVAHVMGKGRRARAVPFGPKTADALRRYRRARAAHPAAALPALWLGKKGVLGDSGLRQILDRRALESGVSNVHPHRFRHTYAHTWLANGGQEQDLMRLAGWRSREMVGRYAASAADGRARDAYHRAGLGDRI
jgi:site-specific recombinase XerD